MCNVSDQFNKEIQVIWHRGLGTPKYAKVGDLTLLTCLAENGNEMYIEDITRWRGDMNFIFEWQNKILRTSPASE